MAGEWRESIVGEIAGASRNALVGGPFGSNLVSRDYVEAGVPVIRGQNMGGRWIAGEFAYVTEAKANSLDANLARPGDIVFTQRGTIGQVSVVPSGKFDRYLVSQSQMKLTVNRELADPLFIYYVFSTAEQVDYIRQHAIQTGVPHTNLGILRGTPVPLPPLPEQRAIAHILGTLDDKIELNRRMNETLEAMARALFKSWFVDFDPVRDKAEGRDPGLPKSLADLFPDSFESSELGEIPKGWKVGVLNQLVNVVLGGDWGGDKQDAERSEPANCIRGADIPDLQIGGKGKMPVRFLKPSSLAKRRLNDSDLVVEISGGSPTQSTGRPVLVSQELLDRIELPLVCSNFCRLIRSRSPIFSKFVYLWLRSLYVKDEFLQFENGTTGIKNLAFTLFGSTFKLCIPPPSILEAFDLQVAPLFKKKQGSAAETDTLAALRATLLPKLISGELRVKDAKKFLSRIS